MSPFDCFEGGREGVIRRILRLMQIKACDVSQSDREYFHQYGGHPVDFFDRIAAGDPTAVTSEAIQSLQISANEGFGEPKFTSESRAAWLKKMHEHGFTSVSAPMEEDHLLFLFLVLEALRELETMEV